MFNLKVMNKEDKELLLRDLCGRLPYGVICKYEAVVPLLGEVLNYGELTDIRNNGEYFIIVNGHTCHYDDIKPFLRTMSSMTEEEKDELFKLGQTSLSMQELNINEIDFLNSHHFDFRGLIEKGLALKAPEEMYRI